MTCDHLLSPSRYADVPPPPLLLPIRGFLRFCLLYQRDLHLKKPTVPPRYSTPACFRINRPLPTCSSSSRLLSYHQVSCKNTDRHLPTGVLALLVNGWVMFDVIDELERLAWTWFGLAHVCPAQVYDEGFFLFCSDVITNNNKSVFIAILQKDSLGHSEMFTQKWFCCFCLLGF